MNNSKTDHYLKIFTFALIQEQKLRQYLVCFFEFMKDNRIIWGNMPSSEQNIGQKVYDLYKVWMYAIARLNKCVCDWLHGWSWLWEESQLRDLYVAFNFGKVMERQIHLKWAIVDFMLLSNLIYFNCYLEFLLLRISSTLTPT